MLKKVVLGTVFAVFIGALITGAAIRTMDKTEPTADGAGSGGGNRRNASIENVLVSEGQGNRRGGWGSAEDGDETAAQERGKGGNGGEGAEFLAEGENDHVWAMYSGVVADVAEEALTIETNDGETIIVEGRAWSFAQEQGFAIQQGDQLQVEGFYENDEFKVSMIENMTTGESIFLRDASGRPSWAGGGRGNL